MVTRGSEESPAMVPLWLVTSLESKGCIELHGAKRRHRVPARCCPRRCERQRRRTASRWQKPGGWIHGIERHHRKTRTAARTARRVRRLKTDCRGWKSTQLFVDFVVRKGGRAQHVRCDLLRRLFRVQDSQLIDHERARVAERIAVHRGERPACGRRLHRGVIAFVDQHAIDIEPVAFIRNRVSKCDVVPLPGTPAADPSSPRALIRTAQYGCLCSSPLELSDTISWSPFGAT